MKTAARNCRRYLLILAAAALMALASAGITGAATANEKAAFDFFTDTMELSPAAACGIMSNIQYESGFQPGITGMGGAYGICQWTGVRQTRLRNWCSSHGLSYSSMQGQLRFLQYELKTYYLSVYRYMYSVTNDASGAYNAGYYWCYYFERPANTYSTAVFRGQKARSQYWPAYANASIYASASAADKGIKISWNAVSKYGYKVYRSGKSGSGYQAVAQVSGSKKSWTDSQAAVGKKYYYYVEALGKNGKASDKSNTVSATKRPSLQDEQCSVKLSKTSYTYNGKARKPGVTVTYNGKKLKNNRDYTVTYSKNKNAGTAQVKVKGKGSYQGQVKLTFKISKAKQTVKVSSAKTAYKSGVYRLKASARGKISYVSSEPSVVTVKKGKLYLKGPGTARITVKAAATGNYKAANKTITLTVTPGKPGITRVTNQKKGVVKLKWKTVSKASGYEIQYAAGSSFKNSKTLEVMSQKKSSVLIKDLKRKKNYRFRIRSYRMTGEKKLYSAWSGAKTIRTK